MKRCKTFLCALTVALSGIFSYSNVKAELVTIENFDSDVSHDVKANIIGNGEVISVRIIWGYMEFTYNTGIWHPESHEYTDDGLPIGHVNASFNPNSSNDYEYKGWSAKAPTFDREEDDVDEDRLQEEGYLEQFLQGNEIAISNDSNVHIAVNPEFELNSSQGGHIVSKFKAEGGYGGAKHNKYFDVDEGRVLDTQDDVYLLPSAADSGVASGIDYKLCLSGAPDVAGLQTDNGKIGEIELTISKIDSLPQIPL